MADLLTSLQAALADRYTVERELGRGGMALVFLAQDLKNHRPVAIKVLRPELAVVLGSDRFLREIEIAARLTHPHILPLYDSGNAEGLLYYVMPYVEGESLRDRLAREKQLAIEDALHIAGEVASALSYAHTHDVIHRDIKPENILLSGGEAVVADFGIARAITAAGGDMLTTTGVTVGTPAYMSPEQAAGESQLDGRTDVFSLGCVLYEMLAGEPPFTGPTAQAINARRLTDPVPSLRTVRETVPEPVEGAIKKALAKVPADRFATANDLARALQVAAAPMVDESLSALGRPRRLAAGALLILAAVGGLSYAVGLLRRRAGQRVRPQSDIVAVLPFHVAGADPTLGFLREGMIDLLAARLTGETGPRALDPRVLMSGWRRAEAAPGGDLTEDATYALARALGAGRLITGGIVAAPRGLVIRASLVPVPPDRHVRINASVEAPLDSLTTLVDRLAAQLLALEAGESEHRLAALTSTSLPALRAYLEGQAAYRRARYEEAVTLFRCALAIDSTFALAGIGLRNAAYWTVHSVDAMPQGLALAWAFRRRLSPRDQAYLAALTGPHYPAPSPYAEQLAGWERAVKEAPDRAEAWYELGEILIHQGAALGLDGALARAAGAFRTALALDSTFLAPLEHLYHIASLQDDTAAVRRLGKLYLTRASGEEAEIVRWQTALALGDSAALRRIRARLDSASAESLALMTFFAQIAMVWSGGLGEADRAVALLLRRAATKDEQWGALNAQHDLDLNRGRPDAALRVTEALRTTRPSSGRHLQARVLDALYWDGDTLAAAAAAHELARRHAPPAAHGAERQFQSEDRCVLEQWRLWNGQSGTAARAVGELRRFAEDRQSSESAARNAVCAALLEALLAHAEKRREVAGKLERLDSLLQSGPAMEDFHEANLALARLWEAHGDPERALAAVRRRPLAPGGEEYLSGYLEAEGRLAAVTGDQAGATRAYRHYLALRSAPEPTVAAEVARVRTELARLEAGSRSR